MLANFCDVNINTFIMGQFQATNMAWWDTALERCAHMGSCELGKANSYISYHAELLLGKQKLDQAELSREAEPEGQ